MSLSSLFFESAYAQTTGGAPTGPSMLEQWLFPIAILLVFYFLIIRPQSGRVKEHKKLLETLKKGDEVLTSGGILGVIEGLTEKYVTLEIASGVRIRILKSAIAGSAKEKAK